MKSFIEYFLKAASENKRFAFGFAFVVLLFGLIVIKAIYNFHTAVHEEIKIKKENLVLLASSVQQGARGDNEKEMKHLSTLEDGLVEADKPSIAAALLQIKFKSAATKNNVTITSERPLKHHVAGVYVMVPIEFALKTGLPGLKGLLSDLRSFDPATGIESISIKTSDGGILDVTLVIQGAMRN